VEPLPAAGLQHICRKKKEYQAKIKSLSLLSSGCGVLLEAGQGIQISLLQFLGLYLLELHLLDKQTKIIVSRLETNTKWKLQLILPA